MICVVGGRDMAGMMGEGFWRESRYGNMTHRRHKPMVAEKRRAM